METSKQAMERLFELIGILDSKNLIPTQAGEYIYGSNLFVPSEKSYYGIARAIVVLQHLRASGYSVPMNIFLVEKEGEMFTICTYKAYFFKDLINQRPMTIQSVMAALAEDEFDLSDGNTLKTNSHDKESYQTVIDTIREKTRYFKVKVDNSCIDRWAVRYYSSADTSNNFEDELKQPTVLKNYIEPCKELPTALCNVCNPKKHKHPVTEYLEKHTTTKLPVTERLNEIFFDAERAKEIIARNSFEGMKIITITSYYKECNLGQAFAFSNNDYTKAKKELETVTEILPNLGPKTASDIFARICLKNNGKPYLTCL